MNAALVLFALALLAGISIPTQAGVNATLDQSLRSPIWAATVSFAVGTVTLLVYALVLRLPLPLPAQAALAPSWSWFGGVLGAFFVSATIYLAPKLGATTMLGALLGGQMLAALILDHFGWLGFPTQPITMMRLLGVGLILAGVWLIRTH